MNVGLTHEQVIAPKIKALWMRTHRGQRLLDPNKPECHAEDSDTLSFYIRNLSIIPIMDIAVVMDNFEGSAVMPTPGEYLAHYRREEIKLKQIQEAANKQIEYKRGSESPKQVIHNAAIRSGRRFPKLISLLIQRRGRKDRKMMSSERYWKTFVRIHRMFNQACPDYEQFAKKERG